MGQIKNFSWLVFVVQYLGHQKIGKIIQVQCPLGFNIFLPSDDDDIQDWAHSAAVNGWCLRTRRRRYQRLVHQRGRRRFFWKSARAYDYALSRAAKTIHTTAVSNTAVCSSFLLCLV